MPGHVFLRLRLVRKKTPKPLWSGSGAKLGWRMAYTVNDVSPYPDLPSKPCSFLYKTCVFKPRGHILRNHTALYGKTNVFKVLHNIRELWTGPASRGGWEGPRSGDKPPGLNVATHLSMESVEFKNHREATPKVRDSDPKNA